MRMRRNDDGSVTFPQCGPPPPATANWQPDPNNPYRLIPVQQPCKHREFISQTLPCGRITGRWVCHHFDGKTITFADCSGCEVPDK